MSNCSSSNRLTISGNLSCSVAGQSDQATIDNCIPQSAVGCCDTSVLGPRPKRQNVREQLHDYILAKLGAPVIEIELDEQQLDIAIDEALDVWEDYAPREFYQYYTFITTPGKSVYTMPPEVGHIRQIYYRATPELAFQATDLGGVIPMEYFYPGAVNAQGGMVNPLHPVWGQMGQWALYKQYETMYSRVSSNIGGWEWVGGRNNIKLYPIPCRAQTVIVHYLQKCKDWECNYQAIREGALASAMMMVGEIRSKFQNIPGPSGGVVLNGADILARGKDMWDKWEERLIYRYGDILPIFVG